MIDTQAETRGGYVLPEDAGLTDVWFPATGGRYTFKTGAEQTEGRLMQVLCWETRGAAPPLHLHSDADESWYILDGEITFFLGDSRTDAGAGDFVFGPQGVPHTYLVTSESARFITSFATAGTQGPAGAGLEGFCREMGVPVREGEPKPAPAPPDPQRFARAAAQYGIEILGPPPTR